ncbi:MAG: hypothetical protein ACK5P7_07360 [Bdellovibrio sp.]
MNLDSKLVDNAKPLKMVMDAASDPESVPAAAVKSEYEKMIQLLKKRGANKQRPGRLALDGTV